jgi:hypothetical protein
MGMASRLEAQKDRVRQAAFDMHYAAGTAQWEPAKERLQEVLDDFEKAVRELALVDAADAVEGLRE